MTVSTACSSLEGFPVLLHDGFLFLCVSRKTVCVCCATYLAFFVGRRAATCVLPLCRRAVACVYVCACVYMENNDKTKTTNHELYVATCNVTCSGPEGACAHCTSSRVSCFLFAVIVICARACVAPLLVLVVLRVPVWLPFPSLPLVLSLLSLPILPLLPPPPSSPTLSPFLALAA